uniref:Roadblock/LAMTOR2 domain-containing protein n=1 Tax=Neobodo designis TaxID=312471 RepID=A0A7S1LAS6_NEODS
MQPVTSLALLKEQIEKSGAESYIVLNEDGDPVEYSGIFQHDDKQQAAFFVLQHSASALRDKEKLKRTTVRFPGCTFVASFVSCSEGTFGVVVQLPEAPPGDGS